MTQSPYDAAWLREARQRLGLSAAALAQELHMPSWGGRTIRRWEAGDNPIPGPAIACLRRMLADHDAGRPWRLTDRGYTPVTPSV